MAAGSKDGVDLIMGSQEPLCLPGRFEPPHELLSLPRRSVRPLDPVIDHFVCSVVGPHGVGDDFTGEPVTFQAEHLSGYVHDGHLNSTAGDGKLAMPAQRFGRQMLDFLLRMNKGPAALRVTLKFAKRYRNEARGVFHVPFLCHFACFLSSRHTDLHMSVRQRSLPISSM